METPTDPGRYLVGHMTVAELNELKIRQAVMGREQGELEHRRRVIATLENELRLFGRSITDRLNVPADVQVAIEDETGEVFVIGALMTVLPDAGEAVQDEAAAAPADEQTAVG